MDTETTDALIRMGAGVVPKLEAALVSDDPKIVMYVAYCLGLIGDDTALPTLQHTRAKYIDREPKQQYDFAVISAINKAEERLLSK
ncbi:MAG: hypothetical protein NTX45_29880 [Proteobacteria bacterium]|nr:hypothetical protein [Pseudomonadota bacterium]